MSSFRFYHPIEIRYSDLDPQKHVNNARYLTYFEQARIAYIRQLGLWDFRSFMDIGFILASAELTFLVPVELGWSVEAGVRVSRLGTKSLTMQYQLEDASDRRPLCTGSSVLVAYDYHAEQTIPLPDIWREKISAYEELQKSS